MRSSRERKARANLVLGGSVKVLQDGNTERCTTSFTDHSGARTAKLIASGLADPATDTSMRTRLRLCHSPQCQGKHLQVGHKTDGAGACMIWECGCTEFIGDRKVMP